MKAIRCCLLLSALLLVGCSAIYVDKREGDMITLASPADHDAERWQDYAQHFCRSSATFVSERTRPAMRMGRQANNYTAHDWTTGEISYGTVYTDYSYMGEDYLKTFRCERVAAAE